MSEETTVVRRGWPILAWGIILLVVGFILWRNAQKPTKKAITSQVSLRVQARYLVGVGSLQFGGINREELYEQAKELLDEETVDERIRLAILAGELVGPEKAISQLGQIREEEPALDENNEELIQRLSRLYTGYIVDIETPDLTGEEQAQLREQLGWFGELALAPEGGDPEARARVLAPARRTLAGYIILGLSAILCLGIGGVLLIIMASLLYLGRLKGGLQPAEGRGGIYAETFAVYMLLYLAVGFLLRLIPEAYTGLWLNGLAMLLALLALVWPRIRGVSWKQICQDTGLSNEGQKLWTILIGLGTYLAAVPLLVAGVVFMLIAVSILKYYKMAPELPTHPIIQVVFSRGWWIWVQVVVIACVFAPVVEEIMFRGVLYRHLRDASVGWGTWRSVMVSVLASSFLFAVIHPQGWLGVPVLMGLASVFALAREWRRSLVPPMIAHGLNNGVSTLILMLVAS